MVVEELWNKGVHIVSRVRIKPLTSQFHIEDNTDRIKPVVSFNYL